MTSTTTASSGPETSSPTDTDQAPHVNHEMPLRPTRERWARRRSALTMLIVVALAVTVTVRPNHTDAVLADTSASGLIPITPRRMYDSRTTGVALTTSATGTTREIPLGDGITRELAALGEPGLPITGAYINVTVVDPTASGFLTLHPTPSSIPDASIVNFTRGDVIANGSLITLIDGTIHATLITPTGDGAAHIIVDVFAITAEIGTSPSVRHIDLTAPQRLLDTRRSEPVDAGGDTVVPTGSRHPILANVTLINDLPDSAPTFISPGDSRNDQPIDVSFLNATSGQIRANTTLLVPDDNGNIKLHNAAGKSHILVDLVARFTDDDHAGTITFLDEPFRAIETRPRPIGPGQSERWDLTPFLSSLTAQRPGLAANRATALIGNLTTTGFAPRTPVFPTTTFLTVFATDGPPPDVSHINVTDNVDLANNGIFPVTDDSLHIYNHDGTVDYLIDVTAIILERP